MCQLILRTFILLMEISKIFIEFPVLLLLYCHSIGTRFEYAWTTSIPGSNGTLKNPVSAEKVEMWAKI